MKLFFELLPTIVCIAVLAIFIFLFNACTASDWNDGECPKCGENLIETEKMVDREYLLSVGAKYCDEKDYPQWLLNLREQHKKERERRKDAD